MEYPPLTIARVLTTALQMASAHAACLRPTAGTFGVPVWKAGAAVGFSTSGLAVDDGAPDS